MVDFVLLLVFASSLLETAPSRVWLPSLGVQSKVTSWLAPGMSEMVFEPTLVLLSVRLTAMEDSG